MLVDELMRFKPDGLTANAWAVKAGVSRNFWNDLRRHGNPSRRTLEKLLAAVGSTLAEFEALRISVPTAQNLAATRRLAESRSGWTSPMPNALPLFASAFAGEWGSAGSGIDLTEMRTAERLELLPCPPSLAADQEAYALTITGESMWPRFRPGRRVVVSPRLPVAIGDDVIVTLRSRLALVKELARRTIEFIELRQFTPDVTFRVDGTEILAIHKVVGELY